MAAAVLDDEEFTQQPFEPRSKVEKGVAVDDSRVVGFGEPPGMPSSARTRVLFDPSPDGATG